MPRPFSSTGNLRNRVSRRDDIDANLAKASDRFGKIVAEELEEVTEPVFERSRVIPLNLESKEAEAVRKIAEAKGVPDAELIRGWVREKIGAS